MSTEINIFEKASRDKLRFDSNKGQLSVEQLWDLPLQSKAGFDLDTIAKGVNSELKELAEESFVSTSSASPQRAALTLKLAVLKHIIGVRLAENEAKRNAEAVAERRRLLTDILHGKQIEQLQNMTPEQIKAELDALGKAGG